MGQTIFFLLKGLFISQGKVAFVEKKVKFNKETLKKSISM